jgi:heptaprenyl diphosphate synthase
VRLSPCNDQEGEVRAPFWEGYPILQADLLRVSDKIISEASSAGGRVGHALIQYVSRPGKLLRPAFVLIGSWAGRTRAGTLGKRASRPATERMIQLAAAVETLHLATLIHDDVIDDSPTRRKAPSLHALHGRKTAVLMGDYLLTRVFTMIAEGTSRENALRLSRATGVICAGEISQFDQTGEPVFSRREYRRRIIGKTALLFGLSLTVGASEANASRRDLNALARAGYNIGMAFQILDDILDFTADTAMLGKPTASDLRSGVYTLPVVEAVLSRTGVRPLVVPPPTRPAEIRTAIEAIAAAGGIAKARDAARIYSSRAGRAIGSLESDQQRTILDTVSRELLSREY